MQVFLVDGRTEEAVCSSLTHIKRRIDEARSDYEQAHNCSLEKEDPFEVRTVIDDLVAYLAVLHVLENCVISKNQCLACNAGCFFCLLDWYTMQSFCAPFVSALCNAVCSRCMCVCACARACVCACVRACV